MKSAFFINKVGDVLSDNMEAPVIAEGMETPLRRKFTQSGYCLPILNVLAFCTSGITIPDIASALIVYFDLTPDEATETTNTGKSKLNKDIKYFLGEARNAGAVSGDELFGFSITALGKRFLQERFQVQMRGYKGSLNRSRYAADFNWFPLHRHITTKSSENKRRKQRQNAQTNGVHSNDMPDRPMPEVEAMLGI